MEIAFLIIGLVLGAVIVYFIVKQRIGNRKFSDEEAESFQNELQQLKVDYAEAQERSKQAEIQLRSTKEKLEQTEAATLDLSLKHVELQTKYETATQELETQIGEMNTLLEKLDAETVKSNKLFAENSELKARKESVEEDLKNAKQTSAEQQQSLQEYTDKIQKTTAELAKAEANSAAATEKLATQKAEIEALTKKFNTEFENIANKILERNTEKFTSVNKETLDAILKPLGENIAQFKTQVSDTYDKESKERFNLAERVKELAELNRKISDEATALTKALKNESKTQGRWGEMILENILEMSGLRKDEEYFLEHQLTDENGNPLQSHDGNTKMRPDAVIKYPDKRSVIIDSKVSLNAYTRYIESDDAEIQKVELQEHAKAVKNHINELSRKGYDDYDKSLDFVMMFIPNEPAYMAVLQADQNIWNYAYDRRILLVNPTNLIISLKLIVDLWKRERQNVNAMEIANRGAKLYNKFVGFVESLEKVGGHIDKAHDAYINAHKQLNTGKDNLVTQATKLKNLGLKTSKTLPEGLLNNQIEE